MKIKIPKNICIRKCFVKIKKVDFSKLDMKRITRSEVNAATAVTEKKITVAKTINRGTLKLTSRQSIADALATEPVKRSAGRPVKSVQTVLKSPKKSPKILSKTISPKRISPKLISAKQTSTVDKVKRPLTIPKKLLPIVDVRSAGKRTPKPNRKYLIEQTEYVKSESDYDDNDSDNDHSDKDNDSDDEKNKDEDYNENVKKVINNVSQESKGTDQGTEKDNDEIRNKKIGGRTALQIGSKSAAMQQVHFKHASSVPPSMKRKLIDAEYTNNELIQKKKIKLNAEKESQLTSNSKVTIFSNKKDKLTDQQKIDALRKMIADLENKTSNKISNGKTNNEAMGNDTDVEDDDDDVENDDDDFLDDLMTDNEKVINKSTKKPISNQDLQKKQKIVIRPKLNSSDDNNNSSRGSPPSTIAGKLTPFNNNSFISSKNKIQIPPKALTQQTIPKLMTKLGTANKISPSQLPQMKTLPQDIKIKNTSPTSLNTTPISNKSLSPSNIVSAKQISAAPNKPELKKLPVMLSNSQFKKLPHGIKLTSSSISGGKLIVNSPKIQQQQSASSKEDQSRKLDTSVTSKELPINPIDYPNISLEKRKVSPSFNSRMVPKISPKTSATQLKQDNINKDVINQPKQSPLEKNQQQKTVDNAKPVNEINRDSVTSKKSDGNLEDFEQMPTFTIVNIDDIIKQKDPTNKSTENKGIVEKSDDKKRNDNVIDADEDDEDDTGIFNAINCNEKELSNKVRKIRQQIKENIKNTKNPDDDFQDAGGIFDPDDADFEVDSDIEVSSLSSLSSGGFANSSINKKDRKKPLNIFGGSKSKPLQKQTEQQKHESQNGMARKRKTQDNEVNFINKLLKPTSKKTAFDSMKNLQNIYDEATGKNSPIKKPPQKILNSTLCKSTPLTTLVSSIQSRESSDSKRNNSIKNNIFSSNNSKNTTVGRQTNNVVIQQIGNKRLKKITCFETWFVINIPTYTLPAPKSFLTLNLVKIGNRITKIKLPSSDWTYRIQLQRISKLHEFNPIDDVYTGEVQDPKISENEKHLYHPINIMFRRNASIKYKDRFKMQFDRAVILKNRTFYINIDGKNIRLVGSPQYLNDLQDIQTLLEIVNDVNLANQFVEQTTVVN